MKLKEKIKNIKLLLLDVDGILTDEKIIFNNEGIESKFFNVKDGHGIKLLQRAGIEVGIITGRESNVVKIRAKELGIELVIQKSHNKLEALKKIIEIKNISLKEIAFCGDDIVDLPVLRRVSVAFTVKNGVEECKKIADYITEKESGKGAVREIVELILKLSGRWEKIFERYKS